jgi:hypothetical protein
MEGLPNLVKVKVGQCSSSKELWDKLHNSHSKEYHLEHEDEEDVGFPGWGANVGQMSPGEDARWPPWRWPCDRSVSHPPATLMQAYAPLLSVCMT